MIVLKLWELELVITWSISVAVSNVHLVGLLLLCRGGHARASAEGTTRPSME